MFSCRLLFLLAALLWPVLSGHAANNVVNLSHYDIPVPDFAQMKREGILAVIHEATYPPGTGDEKYAMRQALALRAGMLWGAYHFANASDPTRQADNFLNFVQRHSSGGAGTLLVLDFESNTHYPGGTMSVRQAASFVTRIKERTGHYPGIYSNENRIRVMTRELEADSVSREVLSHCWLWVANYHAVPGSFSPWGSWTLWQYTGDGICDLRGSGYPKTAGNIRKAERNIFRGSDAGLRGFWESQAWVP